MSKIKLTGHASGTGVLTVTAPNTSTDRTITLPDATGTLLNSDGDGSSLTGVADATKLPLAGGTMTGHLLLNDSVNIKMGAGADFKLSHDGNNSYIEDAGTGALRILSSQTEFKNTADSTIFTRIDSDGIKFGSDTAAANALDDYEEGSHNSVWTTGNSGSITMNRVAMGYVKVGKLVTVTGEIDVTAVSSPIGGVRVTLPFTIASHTAGRNMSFVTKPGMYHVPHHQDNAPCFIGHAGSSHFEGIYEQDNGAFADWNPQAGEAVYFSFSYFTDS